MGCLLHELATGKQAFLTDIAVVTHYLQNAPFLVSLDDKFDDTTKECISDAILRMLQKEPSERPSAATLYDEFCSHCLFGIPAVLRNGQRADSEDTQTSRTDKGMLDSDPPNE
jgi:serine/threonine protein kinase